MVVDLQELARRMLADFDARTPGRIFAEPLELTTIDAYELEAEIARLHAQRGEKVIGYKVDCTSAFMQRQFGVGKPIFARVFGTGCFPAGANKSKGSGLIDFSPRRVSIRKSVTWLDSCHPSRVACVSES